MLLSQLMRSYTASKKQRNVGLLCKLDIEKAFDQLNWSYIISILRQMEFNERWIKWITFNISKVKYSILINRSLVGFFSPQRVLRQGDPLSPFLVIIPMEELSKLLDKAKQMQQINGFDVGREQSNQHLHLLYTNDTLCGAERSQILFINPTLLILEVVSGLHINMLKSVSTLLMKCLIQRDQQPSLGAALAQLQLPIQDFLLELSSKQKASRVDLEWSQREI